MLYVVSSVLSVLCAVRGGRSVVLDFVISGFQPLPSSKRAKNTRLLISEKSFEAKATGRAAAVVHACSRRRNCHCMAVFHYSSVRDAAARSVAHYAMQSYVIAATYGNGITDACSAAVVHSLIVRAE